MNVLLNGESAALQGCVVSLERCGALLEALDGASFAARPSGGASIGEHLRHCLDHFACFEAGLDEGVVDYDERAREVTIETNLVACRERIDQIIAFLRTLSGVELDRAITVSQTAAPGRPPTRVASTVARELVFLSSHTIHHVAIADLTAKLLGRQDVAVEVAAYSTAAHRESLLREQRAAG